MQPGSATAAAATIRKTAGELESILIRQLLTSSGAFHGDSAVPGSTLNAERFTEVLAQAVARAGGLGLAPLLERSLGAAQGSSDPRLEPGISSGFGERLDPLSHRPSMHTGIDLPAPEGTPIPAARDGEVVSAGPRGDYGVAVELRHADGSSTLYAHAQEVLVTPGQQVRAGDPVALVGQTGRATGPHLHLEVRSAGHFIDPRVALKAYHLRADSTGGGEP